MKQLLAAFIVLVGFVGLVACAPASSVPVAEQTSVAPALQETTLVTQQPTLDPIALKKAKDEEDHRAYDKVQLNILKGLGREYIWPPTLEGHSSYKGTCNAYDSARAGEYLRDHLNGPTHIGMTEAVLGGLVRSAEIRAVKELFTTLKNLPSGEVLCGRREISDPIEIDREIRLFLSSSVPALTEQEVGFRNEDLRKYVLIAVRKEVSLLVQIYKGESHIDTEVGRDRLYDFLRAGLKAKEIGLPEDVAQKINVELSGS